MRRLTAGLPALLTVVLLLAMPVTALAATTITAATGGTGMIVGNYTTLSGPTVVEGVIGDIGLGEIVLNAPFGFEFLTASTPMATASNAGGTCNGNRSMRLAGNSATQTASVTAAAVTIRVTRITSGTCLASITWAGIQVRAVVGSTPPVTGNITKSGTSTGIAAGANMGSLSATIAPTATATATPTATSTPTHHAEQAPSADA